MRDARRAGFTLIELLAVITIIGILIALILVAAADGVRRAEERATQGLITKLETALNDRIDALLNAQAPMNQTHRFLAAVNYKNANGVYVPVGSINATGGAALGADVTYRRAQVIAQFDYLRAQIPEVFFLNSATTDDFASSSYPLNFAATAYPPGSKTLPDAYILPLGNNSPGLPLATLANGNQVLAVPTFQATPYGMFGASFAAAGGLYKNLGYTTQGYDGVDNDNNGLIDDLPEGTPPGMTSAAFLVNVNAQLAKHTHKTARSEVLYAILVEGLGPLGSSFGRDDFTSKEVQDTDGDGLPEFVDAWGQPLQFYRWPIYYGGPPAFGTPGPILGTSDSQRGPLPYSGSSQYREQDPLDANQLLVAPAWWSSLSNPSLTMTSSLFSPPNGASSANISQGAVGFMANFHILVDPSPGNFGKSWDRNGAFARRAYFSKFLILSGGPDRIPGTAQLGYDYSGSINSGTSIFAFPDGTTGPIGKVQENANYLLFIENQAAVSDPTGRTGSFYEVPDSAPTSLTNFLQADATLDDITNHNISGPSTGVR